MIYEKTDISFCVFFDVGECVNVGPLLLALLAHDVLPHLAIPVIDVAANNVGTSTEGANQSVAIEIYVFL
jgi:hypothetical protein